MASGPVPRSRLSVAALALAAIAASGAGVHAAPTVGQLEDPATGRTRAGVAVVDASWHVGASSGQYASSGAASGPHGVDPYVHATRKLASYGAQSRISVRALIVEGASGGRIAMVANDLYLPQDLLVRRVAGLVERHDLEVALGVREGHATGITADRLAITASHSHGSPYYSTPSWGVWVFQDVFDLRFFEYMATRMAQAVIDAAADLRPVRIGGARIAHHEVTSHSYGPQIADDGTPAGAPWSFTTGTVSVVAFDDVTDPGSPQPLATWIVGGMHPEFTNRDDLVTGEFDHAVYRILEREIGGVVLLSKQEVGTAGPHKDLRVHPPDARREFQDMGFSQMDRAARIFADGVKAARARVEAGTPEDPLGFASFADDLDVGAVSIRFAPPATRPYPGVSNCRSEKAFQGNPGVPIAGFPDCVFPFAGQAGPVGDVGHQLYEQLKEVGVPIPESYSPPAYTGLEETVALHLQAFKIGPIAVTFCPCEQFTDQVFNIQTRLDRDGDNVWTGWDWTTRTVARDGEERAFCVQNEDTTWTCANPRNQAQDLAPVGDVVYRRMLAQIHNDAAGWEDVAYTASSEAEPADPAQIKGNFTHAEHTEHGYDLVLAVGMANDYWGYIPSYRDYQAFDHYRKALAGLGPHGSDFIATRLVRMAASLNGAPPMELRPLDLLYQAEHVQMQARAMALGDAAAAYLEIYEAALPGDGGVPQIVEQPSSIDLFDAATTTWIGGSNWTDFPEVRVERLEGEEWIPYGDSTGGNVQLLVRYPQQGDLPAWRQGSFEWRWTANFEAFISDVILPDASGIPRHETPLGIYRFAIEGQQRSGGHDQPYTLTSEPFEVLPWDGITVDDLRIEPDGSVSFRVGPVNEHTFGANTYTVGPIDYPDSYDSVFRYVRDGVRIVKTYGLPFESGLHQQYCPRCSFRPWADTSTVVDARVTVLRAGGGTDVIVAERAGDRWVAATGLGPDDAAFVDRGGIVDDRGQVNGDPSPWVVA